MKNLSRTYRASHLSWLSSLIEGSRLLPVLTIALAASVFSALSPGLAHGAQERHIRVELGSHGGPVRRIAVSDQFKMVATASDDKTVRIWDLNTGALRHILRPRVGADETGRMYGIAIHPTEDLLAVGGTTGTGQKRHEVLLFQLTTGQLVSTFDARAGHIKDLRWSGDGSLLFAIYDGSHGFRAFNRAGSMVFEENFTSPSYGLDASQSGLVAVGAYDGYVRLYQTNGGTVRAIKKFKPAYPFPRSVAFSPDDRLLAVGYRGSQKDQGAPTIYDANSGQRILQMERPDSGLGDMRAVNWSADGSQLIAAGSRYVTERQHPIYVFNARSGDFISKTTVASNSITDLTHSASQSVYASFDGTWGTLQNGNVMLSVGGNLPDFRGPKNLKISPDAKKFAVGFANGQRPAWFDFAERRLIQTQAPSDLVESKTKNGFFDSSKWKNTRQPKVFGAQIKLLGAEISRSISFMPNDAGALLGTSKRFKKIDSDGRTVWDVPAPGEVWAINVSANGKVAVTTQSDGTVRWWRTDNGTIFLSMFILEQGRWVAWTADGYYDADIGADRMVGWAVNRDEVPLSDYFSLNRFRDQFNRPDKISEALASALGERPAKSANAAPVPQQAATKPANNSKPAASAASRAPILATAASIALTVPPVVELSSLKTAVTANQQLSIPVSVRSKEAVSLEVRVNGRPVQSTSTAAANTTQPGQPVTLSTPQPAPGSTVQVIAKSAAGTSEPLSFTVPQVAVVPSPTIVTTTLTPVPAVPAPKITGVTADRGIGAPSSIQIAAQRAKSQATAARLFILSIGVSDYERPAYRLQLAAKDATDFSNVFKSQPNEFYSEISSRLLVDADASRANILAGLTWLRESVTDQDIGVVFLAGHGLNAPDGKYYYLPYDGQHENLSNTGVEESVLRDTLGTIRGKSLLFVDTCHAGRAIGQFSTARRELTRLANDLAAAENGVIVFASSTAGQLSEESDVWQNGAFTKALVEGLLGNADFRATGRVTYKGLDYFVSSEVSRLTEARQTPITISPVGLPDFNLTKVLAAR